LSGFHNLVNLPNYTNLGLMPRYSDIHDMPEILVLGKNHSEMGFAKYMAKKPSA